MSFPARMVTLCALAALLVCAGCSQMWPLPRKREKFRGRADTEANSLIVEKSVGPNWQLEDFNVYPDAASRMFDPFSPDAEPMPPDDPFSHRLMHLIDGRRGFPHWHKNGDTNAVQNPNWISCLGLDQEGVLRLDEATAIRLALLHSPDYQVEREDLFLSALDVSTERFRFDTQVFAGYGTEYSASGQQRSPPGSQLAIGTPAPINANGMGGRTFARRFFTTGASFMAGFANTLVWQFSGPQSQSATTILDFAFIQPLLRNAGRDRILETLTIAERALLANVRQLEWFRKGFNLEVTTGRGGQAGPQRRGGAFGSGLTGFIGTGGAVGFGGGGVGGGGGGGVAGGLGGSNAGGFLGLLQTQQTLRNEETNIAQLRSSLDQLEAFKPSGRIDYFQVDLVRQQLFDNTSRFLANKRAYQDSLDGFKRTLGLPPQLPVRIEDTLLDRFRLIDPAMAPRTDRLDALQRETGKAILPLLPDPVAGEEEAWRERMRKGIRQLMEQLEEAGELRTAVASDNLKRAAEDLKRLEEALPERIRQSKQLERQSKQTSPDPTEPQLMQYVDESLFETDYLDELPEQIRGKLVDLERRLEALGMLTGRLGAEGQALLSNLDTVPDEQLGDLAEQIRERLLRPFPALLTNLSTEFLQVSLEQARARTEQIRLAPIDITAPLALEVARDNRLDWMNARAALVDAWRLIEFNADNLEGFLNLRVDGDVVNGVDDNPFNLSRSTSRLRMGIEFDAPFTRLQERNVYRESLIDFQRSRRSYYRFEDNIAASLRAILRQVQLDKVNFELRRRALRVAVDQVLLARLELLRPPRIEGDQLGPTTAQNLINALNSLRNAQDAYLAVWIDYEIQRKLLDLSMGTLQLDSEGLWVDPGAIGVEHGYPEVTAEILSAVCYDPVNIDREPELEEVGPVQVESVEPGGASELPRPAPPTPPPPTPPEPTTPPTP